MLIDRLLDLFGRGPRPRLVVTGMPKSGTTAIAMLLGAAAGLRVNSDPFYRLDRAGVDFRDALYGGQLPLARLLHEHRRFFRGGLVKDPNFIYLADLFDAFPGARFVFTVRDPRDNIRSLLNRLRLPGRITDPPATLTDVPDTWRRALEGRTPDVSGSNYIERLAHRWALAARNYLQWQDRMELMRYELFNADKPAAVEAALARMEIRGGRPVQHLAERQFQPRGQRGIAAHEFFGETELESIERICASEMDRLGYATRLHNA